MIIIPDLGHNVIIFIALDIHLQYHSKFTKNLKSSGMLYCVSWYPVPDVSNYCSVFIVRVKQSKKSSCMARQGVLHR